MDRISQLPQGIIETILCVLPIQEAARTSILSRGWRYHWIKIPKLVFIESAFQVSIDEAEVPEQTFDKRKELAKRYKFFYAINQVLLMHEGPIYEFTLRMEVDRSYVEIDHIILHLSKKYMIKILQLDFHPCYKGCRLPISLFSLHQLTYMYLSDCAISHERSFNELGCLTTLHLECIWTCEKTLLRLLSSCPLLKRLTLDNDNSTISDSGLSTINNLFECLPVIEYLNIPIFIVMCFVPERLPKELSTTLVHLKDLSMNNVCFTHKYGLPFLVLLIRSSLNLKKLKLVYAKYGLNEVDMGSYTVEDYSDIMLEHLNELEILNFSDSKNELDFVKLILAKSLVLKKVNIFSHGALDEDEESRILKILLCSPCASPVVKIILKRLNPNWLNPN